MKQAFLSVSKKEGIEELARTLLHYNIQLIASDGTADFLRSRGLEVKAVSDYLELQPFLDGRVKTLHPAVYGGILADRNKPTHLNDLQHLNIDLIDFVIVDLYPFEECRDDQQLAIENIDIGGISLIRAAAKNHQFCTVVCDARDYALLRSELMTNQGITTFDFRKKMAVAAFRKSTSYDEKIASWLDGDSTYNTRLTKTLALSYGENPHQLAGFYNGGSAKPMFTVLQGKPVSYNNILDLDAGINLVKEFQQTAVTVIKHTNPCGMAIGESVYEAITKAFDADRKSAFGGIVILNRTLDAAGADFLAPHFLELIAAPGFSKEAIAILSKKPKLRVLQYEQNISSAYSNMKSVLNGVLIQEPDQQPLLEEALTCPTQRKPSQEELRDLIFAFKLAKHVKSNAIAIAQAGVSLSIGAGQTNRVDAVAIALEKIQGTDLSKTVLASDGFFPFADSIELIAKSGIKAIIQPGGSIRDEEVIAACDQFNLCMVLTNRRAFKH